MAIVAVVIITPACLFIFSFLVVNSMHVRMCLCIVLFQYIFSVKKDVHVINKDVSRPILRTKPIRVG